MTSSFVYAPPSNEFGAKSKSPLKWTKCNHSVLFRELLLLARTSSSGRCINEANQLSLSLNHDNLNMPKLSERLIVLDSSAVKTAVCDAKPA
jgi:hypothetical protein